MKAIILHIFFLLVIIYNISAQQQLSILSDTTSSKYYPLQVGNKYIYNVGEWLGSSGMSWDTSYIGTSIITNQVSINGKIYYYVTNLPHYDGCLIRYDSLSGKLLVYGGVDSCNYEMTAYKLSSGVGQYNGNCSLKNFQCIDSGSTSIFGISRSRKTFYISTYQNYNTLTSRFARFAYGIGCIYSEISVQTQWSGSGGNWSLKGAEINGVVYGDTTTVTFNINESRKYFPLKTGNIYVYKAHIVNYNGSRDTVYKGKVIKDTTIGGRKYFKLTGFPSYSSSYWYRIDTNTASLMFYDNSNTCSYYNNEKFVDSLAAYQGNIMKNCGQSFGTGITLSCSLVDTLKLFYNNTYKKVFNYNSTQGSYISYSKYYAKNFGLYAYNYSSNNPSITESHLLKGCILNGIVYGDTTSGPIGIQNISSSIPAEFELSQNFPNPFNPVTNISFSLPRNGNVSLVVYDVFGKEVVKLINNVTLNPGEYKIDFNGTNLASGIYFYKFETSDFTETKRMVLLK